MKVTAEHLHKAAEIIGSSESPVVEDYGLPIDEIQKFTDEAKWFDAKVGGHEMEMSPLALAMGISIGFIAGHDFVEHKNHEVKLTPRWCHYCECYVPVEREPHCSPKHQELHYALYNDKLEAEREGRP